MPLRILVLHLLFIPSGARRSIRIDDSRNHAQRQNNRLASGLEVSAEAQEALIPGRVFFRAGPRSGTLRDGFKQAGRHAGHLESHRVAPCFRFGPRRANVALQATASPEKDQLLSNEALREHIAQVQADPKELAELDAVEDFLAPLKNGFAEMMTLVLGHQLTGSAAEANRKPVYPRTAEVSSKCVTQGRPRASQHPLFENAWTRMRKRMARSARAQRAAPEWRKKALALKSLDAAVRQAYDQVNTSSSSQELLTTIDLASVAGTAGADIAKARAVPRCGEQEPAAQVVAKASAEKQMLRASIEAALGGHRAVADPKRALAARMSADSWYGRLPGAVQRLEAWGRPALERYLEDRGAAVSVVWLDAPLGAGLQRCLWENIAVALTDEDKLRVLALPYLEPSAAAALLDLPASATECVQLQWLPADAPVRALLIERAAAVAPSRRYPSSEKQELVYERSRTWAQRTLAPGPLGFCPFTASATVSGAGLEALGVTPAPIAYAACASGALPDLFVEFWRTVEDRMLAPGESGTSSILLMAPAWDDRWEEWKTLVFPTLEAMLVAAGLTRTLGIVCFHPCYSTPDASYLARHRFGHMHSTARLRSWLDAVDPPLSATVSDAELHWAGSYQRRSPHATINVLWARQLEVAEQRRDSATLYTRNLRRALNMGLERLHRDAQMERGCPYESSEAS